MDGIWYKAYGSRVASFSLFFSEQVEGKRWVVEGELGGEEEEG